MGQGNARNETTIGRVASHVFLDNGDLILLDYNACYSRYDKDILMKDYLRFLYEREMNDGSKDREQLYANPYSYTHQYEEMIRRSLGDSIYFNARLAYPKCGYIPTTKLHLEKRWKYIGSGLKEKGFWTNFGYRLSTKLSSEAFN